MFPKEVAEAVKEPKRKTADTTCVLSVSCKYTDYQAMCAAGDQFAPINMIDVNMDSSTVEEEEHAQQQLCLSSRSTLSGTRAANLSEQDPLHRDLDVHSMGIRHQHHQHHQHHSQQQGQPRSVQRSRTKTQLDTKDDLWVLPPITRCVLLRACLSRGWGALCMLARVEQAGEKRKQARRGAERRGK
eukprot:CAMPEP_0181340946 /NCGR_PEP_ID=MMETSP1101-20121128/30128_1 /TAXON_ID=46948 /ORGANISM="Rhodomonas abbreviata, Strain Caron Lab Isolate" /LENGTH=185 /DNA_ID=CAMNT_0023452151 /DNA_START=42 /DNA_END=600 /DNA_ORIENTATION=-